MFLSFSRNALQVENYCETENTDIAAIQKFFRENDSDEYAGEKSFTAGSSASNQVCLIVIDAIVSKFRNLC